MSAEPICRITGRAVPLRGDDIDTDRIIPARYLRCVTFDGLGEHAFEDDRRQDPGHPFNQSCYAAAAVLVAGRNFGCGSSREHAPQALRRWGIRAVAAPSFAEIFFGNCTNMGIPCVVLSAADVEALWQAVEADPCLELTVDVAQAAIAIGARRFEGSIPAGVRRSLTDGTWNATTVLLEAGGRIDAVVAALPYRHNFA